MAKTLLNPREISMFQRRMDDDLIPTKDPGGYDVLDIDLTRPDALLIQQRTLVSKLSREDLEDR